MKKFKELKETLDVPTFSPETLAKKHGVSLETIEAQLKAGIAVEKEHTSDPATAREIALDHLGEKPDYYAKLDKANLEESTWEGYRLEALLESRYEDAMMSRLPAHLTPRERMSGGERLAPVKDAPLDHAAKQKQELAKHDNTNDSVRKNLSQGGVDSAAHKTTHHGTASKSMTIHEADLKAQWNRDFTKDSYARRKNLRRTIKQQLDPKTPDEELNKEEYNMTFNESGSEGYKVGDKVVAKIGPHKGTVHTVIHVHPTGHLNIKPDVHVRSNRYHLGAAKADPKDVTRHLEEATLLAGREEKPLHPNDMSKEKAKASKKWGSWGSWGTKGMDTHFPQSKLKGINRKTVQEAFQAAKDKKNPFAKKTDSLPGDGANEPNAEKPNSPSPQPQDGGAPTTPQDGGAPQPGAEKKDNTPKPENPNSKKIQVKGPGPDDKFQDSPIVTPLTHMPDTGNPRSGSAASR